jgi:hypothetical protein
VVRLPAREAVPSERLGVGHRGAHLIDRETKFLRRDQPASQGHAIARLQEDREVQG